MGTSELTEYIRFFIYLFVLFYAFQGVAGFLGCKMTLTPLSPKCIALSLFNL